VEDVCELFVFGFSSHHYTVLFAPCCFCLSQIDKIVSETGALFLSMSNVTEEGVSQVKNDACKLLQAHRVATKMKGKKVCCARAL
jgi:hypothetical protein